MSLAQKFIGIVPPVVTPYLPDGQVDTKGLRRVVRHLLDNGVHGLFLLGSTSECVLLSEQQRMLVLTTALEEIKGQVPVVAGVMDAATELCIGHGLRARDAGVNGLVLTAPYYTRTNQTETVDHFRYVHDAVGLPIIAYDIPVCVHTKLARETIHRLAKDEVIIALKDSSGDEGNFRMLLRDFADQPLFRLFTGSELVADTSVLMGAAGCVPGLANVDPAGYVRLYAAAARGDLAAAKAEQDRLIDLFQMVFWSGAELSPGAGGVGAFKVAMKLMGLIGNSRMGRPNRPVPASVEARIEVHLKRFGLLEA